MLDVARQPSLFSAVATAHPEPASAEGQRIRFFAADLFRQGRLAEAERLTREAMQQHPDSEDVLVIRALICEAAQDWPGAAQALEHLLQLQGQHAPAESWCHWVRVLRCNSQLQRAFAIALQALQYHPAHPIISSELAQLEAMGVPGTQLAA